MKALTFGLMLVLVALVAVGTASAGITYGTPTAIGTCGVDCTIYTVTDTNIFTTYSSAGAAIPLLLPEFGGSPSQLTSAVFSVDGYVEGTISLINGGCCASAVLKGTTSGDFSIQNDPTGLDLVVADPTFSYATGNKTVASGATQIYGFNGVSSVIFNGSPSANPTAGTNPFSTSVAPYTHALVTTAGACTSFSGGPDFTTLGCFEGGGNFTLYFDATAGVLASTVSGGNGQTGGTQFTVAAADGSVTYVYQVDTSGVPEPTSLALLGCGLGCLAFFKRKRS